MTVKPIVCFRSARLRLSILTVAVVSLCAMPSVVLRAENWPQFRGENSTGAATSICPVSWDSQTNVCWKVSLPGEGWSCPVVWETQVFLTQATRIDAGGGSSRPEPYAGGGGRRRTDLTQATYRWELICLDADSGSVIWRRAALEGRPRLPRHSSNSYATETPVTDGERVYAYFGMHGLYCFDLRGTPLWQKDLGSYEMRAGWGTASSPVLHRGRLFLQIDNQEQSFVVALNAKSGEELWRVNREEPSQYSSPIVWKNSLRDELIVGGQFYRSYDPVTGKLLWELDMQKGRSSATPLAIGDRLYVGTEFRNRGGSDDGGGFLFALKPGGTGSLAPADKQQSDSSVLWQIERSGIQMASPVLCAGHLYLLERRSGTLHCIDAETGQTAYRKRISGARAFWASPWTCDAKVYCLDSNGTTHVLAGGSQYQLLARNSLDEQTWSSPAVTDGKLYLRTAGHLFCIGSDGQRASGEQSQSSS